MVSIYLIKTIGVIISSVPNEQKAAASSLAVILMNLLGYIPAPFLYGIINDVTKDSNPRLAMTISLYYSVTGFVWMLLSVIFRVRLFKQKEKEEQMAAELRVENANKANLRHSTEFRKTENRQKKTFVEILRNKPSTVSFAMLYQNFNPNDIPDTDSENQYIEEEDSEYENRYKFEKNENRRSFDGNNDEEINKRYKGKMNLNNTYSDDGLISDRECETGGVNEKKERSNSLQTKSTKKEILLSKNKSKKKEEKNEDEKEAITSRFTPGNQDNRQSNGVDTLIEERESS